MLFIKGVLIGIAKIIPGLSGSLLAISFNIYYDAIDKFLNLFKDIKSNFKYLFILGNGILLGIFIGCKWVIFLIDNFYLSTMLLFIGILIKDLKLKIKLLKNINFINYLIFILTSHLSLFISQIKNIKFNNFFLEFIIGFIDSFAMIVPGISGTAIMMNLNIYDKYLNLFNFNINIIKYFIGLLIGCIIFFKLINFLKNNYNKYLEIMVLGFTLSGVLMLFLETLKNNYNLIEIIIALIFFIIGFKVT